MPIWPQDMRTSPLEEFSAMLTDGLRRGYRDLFRDFGSEHFYATGLAYADEPSALVLAANSQEALDRVVMRYVANGAEADAVRAAIRWSRVSEWEYHRYGEPLLADANRVLSDFYGAHKAWVWGFPPDERPGATLRELDNRVLGVLRDVVRQLDAEGVFSGEQPRDDIIVSLWPSIGNDRATLERAAWFNATHQLVPMQRTLGPPQ